MVGIQQSPRSLPITRPPFPSFGGKWLLAPQIIPFLPPHTRYVEPFAGSASVLLRKGPSAEEVINDADNQIVGFFRVLREREADLIRAVELTPYSRTEWELGHEPTDDPIEQARRFVARASMSWGGHRKVRHGFRTVNGKNPWPPDTWHDLPDQLRAIADRLKHVLVECADWRVILDRHDSPDTCWYVDPPYWKPGRHKYRCELTQADHVELAHRLHTVQGAVVLSGCPSDLYDALYSGWRREGFEARTVANTPTVECLWLSPKTVSRQHQGNLF